MTLNVYMAQHLRNKNFEWHNIYNIYDTQQSCGTTFEKYNFEWHNIYNIYDTQQSYDTTFEKY